MLAAVVEQVSADLRAAKIKAVVTGRPKHYYSIYQKMIVRGRDFNDIYDLVGAAHPGRHRARLLRRARRHPQPCGTPVPGRFKDYIAMPKFNMYQSLHTTVIGPEGKPVEMQIRTHAMHRRAEYGIAAHWKYKENDVQPVPASAARGGDKDGAEDMTWLRQLLDWQRETPDPGEFLDSLRFDLHASGGLRLHAQGRRHRAAGRRHAGRLRLRRAHRGRATAASAPGSTAGSCRWSPRWTTATSIEVFTSKSTTAGPRRDWLALRPSHRGPATRSGSGSPRSAARTRSRRARTRSAGRCASRACRCSACSAATRWPRSPSDLRYPDVSALYAAVGEGHVSAQTVVQRLVAALGGAEGAVEDIAETAVADPADAAAAAGRRPRRRGQGRQRRLGQAGPLLHAGAGRRRSSASSPAATASPCTAPTASTSSTLAPEARAHASRSSGPRRPVGVPGRDPGRGARPHPAAVRRDPGAVRRSTSTSCRRRSRRRATGSRSSKFTFEMGDPKHLGHLLRAVRDVEGVYDAYRVTSGKNT